MRAGHIHFISGFLKSCLCAKLHKQYSGLWQLAWQLVTKLRMPQCSSALYLCGNTHSTRRKGSESAQSPHSEGIDPKVMFQRKWHVNNSITLVIFKIYLFSYPKSYFDQPGIFQKLSAGSHDTKIRNIERNLDTKRKFKTSFSNLIPYTMAK